MEIKKSNRGTLECTIFEDKRAFDWSEEFNGLKEVYNLSNFRILARFKCKERWGRNWWIQFVKTGQVEKDKEWVGWWGVRVHAQEPEV